MLQGVTLDLSAAHFYAEDGDADDEGAFSFKKSHNFSYGAKVEEGYCKFLPRSSRAVAVQGTGS